MTGLVPALVAEALERARAVTTCLGGSAPWFRGLCRHSLLVWLPGARCCCKVLLQGAARCCCKVLPGARCCCSMVAEVCMHRVMAGRARRRKLSTILQQARPKHVPPCVSTITHGLRVMKKQFCVRVQAQARRTNEAMKALSIQRILQQTEARDLGYED